jgi:hypothetical protein
MFYAALASSPGEGRSAFVELEKQWLIKTSMRLVCQKTPQIAERCEKKRTDWAHHRHSPVHCLICAAGCAKTQSLMLPGLESRRAEADGDRERAWAAAGWSHSYRTDQRPFLFEHKGSPAEYKAGLDLAIARGRLWLHESGTFVRLTEEGAGLFTWVAIRACADYSIAGGVWSCVMSEEHDVGCQVIFFTDKKSD